jgi:hypothetical protein
MKKLKQHLNQQVVAMALIAFLASAACVYIASYALERVYWATEHQ